MRAYPLPLVDHREAGLVGIHPIIAINDVPQHPSAHIFGVLCVCACV